MTRDVTLLDLLSAPDTASLNSWFMPLLLVALVASGWIAAAVFRRLRRQQQAVAEIRARALLDQWNEAGAHALHRPPTRLQQILDEHEMAEKLHQGDDCDGLTTEWWPFTDRRHP
ncbi:hypothetical protein [Nonomuraea sp. NPDC049028]|uniref:hypothetical protein n=1 Tax=Nonomuraea sp. NPDC049028 TaxID=3364348 RepID=UPI003713B6AE